MDRVLAQGAKVSVPATTVAARPHAITGIAVLGLLAGSLASFFRLDGGETAAGSPAGEPASTAATSNDAALQALATEVSALRRQRKICKARAGPGDALADYWLRTWKQALPGSDPEQAWHLLRPLAALRAAAVYQHFLDNIEPSERIYHEEDVRPALEIAARLAAHDSRR